MHLRHANLVIFDMLAMSLTCVFVTVTIKFLFAKGKGERSLSQSRTLPTYPKHSRKHMWGGNLCASCLLMP